MMLLHAAFDFAGNLPEIAVGGGLELTAAPIRPMDALVTILITLPLFLYGLFLLRKVEPVTTTMEDFEWESNPQSSAAIS